MLINKLQIPLKKRRRVTVIFMCVCVLFVCLLPQNKTANVTLMSEYMDLQMSKRNNGKNYKQYVQKIFYGKAKNH